MRDITHKYKKMVAGKEFNIFEGSRGEMRKLGRKWMKDNKFHEVISFPLEESVGDVVVFEGAKNRDFLVEHGVKHLRGEHHE